MLLDGKRPARADTRAKVTLRMGARTHAKAVQTANLLGVSLNAYILEVLMAKVKEDEKRDDASISNQ